MVVFALLLIGVLAVGAFLALGLRSWTLAESRTEARLRRPGAPTLTYTVPPGQDPAVLMAALRHAGYTSVTDLKGGGELLVVECPDEHDRADVRSIIEHVDRAGFDGPEMHVAHVAFEDER